MATKTFKIGLSNTDKQNMAQEVYERLLALTFPEYDTTESYDVGDFVVYNDQLYKCIGATTGAWDSSKWQLATLNDLLTDIESAVAFVNDKANVDGNYPTMTVGFADALTPYDSDSGDDQDEPFSFQATGTGNGTQPDFSTGSTALMKEKRGNSVVVNQLINESARTSTNAGVTYTISLDSAGNAVVSLSGTANDLSYVSLGEQINNINGHKVLILGCPSTGDATKYFLRNGYDYSHDDTGNGNISTIGQDGFILQLIVINGTNVDGVVFRPISVDLTQWFGSNDNIPPDLLSHPENFFRYYQGDLAYNTGTLVNANSRYLKAIGRNQWDEEYKNGYYDESTDGSYSPLNNYLANKNQIKVIPNATYHLKGVTATVLFYDKDGNYLGDYIQASSTYPTFTIPANCCFINFYCDYGSNTYANDITISIYYEDETGYDQYYPYEVLTNNDTGTETLRSAGNVADIKLPSGEIKRNVGVVDLGTFTWEYVSQYGVWITTSVSNVKNRGQVICDKYNSANNLDGNSMQNGDLSTYWGWWGDTPAIIVKNSDSSNSPTGTLYYELATPTTEQGTPYSENLFIDDFGSMDFSGTNGVPQGNLIFYPVDYKAFIDTLYDYTDGTPSNIALKSDLASDKSELQGVDSELKNALGGTLRHLLVANNSGLDFNNTAFLDIGNSSATWTKGSTAFSTTGFSTVLKIPTSSENCKLLCSNYKMICKSANSVSGNANTYEIYITSGGQIVWYYPLDEFADADAFKNAMKGVLLAYEKA